MSIPRRSRAERGRARSVAVTFRRLHWEDELFRVDVTASSPSCRDVRAACVDLRGDTGRRRSSCCSSSVRSSTASGTWTASCLSRRWRCCSARRVHKALEALLQRDSDACSFTQRQIDHARLDCAYDVYSDHFMAMRRALDPIGVECSSTLFMEGLRMVDQVAALNLNQDGRLCA